MEKAALSDHNKRLFHVSVLAVAIAAAYFKIFHAGFIAWDDSEYVVNNHDIDAVDFNNISLWFSKYYIGNYHPLTMLSYAMDNLIGSKNPFIYHFTNLVLHAANTIIIYFLINRLQPNKNVGFFTALLFAVNPLNTESVSWIAERKTTLCGLFYFLALISYTYYVDNPALKRMAVIILLGTAAMLSKGIGVALPLSLIAVDIWMGRDMAKKQVWMEKIPLMITAFIIGVVAIRAQEAGKFLNLHPEYNWYDTIVFAGYAYVQYIVHFFVPWQVSVIYPYPQHMGVLEYFFLLMSFTIIVVGFIAYRKKWLVLCGGIIFFTVNIFLVLQFVQFGEFLMADRYLYIASIGILFPFIFYLFKWLQQAHKEIIATAVLAIAGVVLLLQTYIRNDIWLSDFNFFTAILEAFPNSSVAQYSVGGLYMRKGDYPEAETHINLAVALDPGNYKAWYNKGALYLREQKPAESLQALNECLKIKEYPKAYFTRALLYEGTGQPALALPDIGKVLEDQPGNARAYYIKADCLEQQGIINGAMDNYNKAIEYDGKEPLFFVRRGLAYAKMKQTGAAMDDLNTAVALNPGNGEALYFRGVIKAHTGQNPCDDLRRAVSCGYKNAAEALGKACK